MPSAGTARKSSQQPAARGRHVRRAHPARHHGDGARPAGGHAPADQRPAGQCDRGGGLRVVRRAQGADAALQPLFAPAGRADRHAPVAGAGAGAPRQVQLFQLRRQQSGQPGGQAPGAPRGAAGRAGAAARRDRHGQELLAHAIHGASGRADKPLVTVNVAAIPDTLLEVEFFGAAAGAYTGADRKGRVGKFELAHGGTLFLDEIGDLQLPLQGKLLRALQERNSSRWARTGWCTPMCASSRLPRWICRPWWRRAGSAPTCTTGSMC